MCSGVPSNDKLSIHNVRQSLAHLRTTWANHSPASPLCLVERLECGHTISEFCVAFVLAQRSRRFGSHTKQTSQRGHMTPKNEDDGQLHDEAEACIDDDKCDLVLSPQCKREERTKFTESDKAMTMTTPSEEEEVQSECERVERTHTIRERMSIASTTSDDRPMVEKTTNRRRATTRSARRADASSTVRQSSRRQSNSCAAKGACVYEAA